MAQTHSMLASNPLLLLMFSALVGIFVGIFGWFAFFRRFFQRRELARRKFLFLMSFIAFTCFAAILYEVLTHHRALSYDTWVIDYMQQLVNAPSLAFLAMYTHIGGVPFLAGIFFFIALVLLLKRNGLLLTLWSLAIIGSTVCNQLLKYLVARPRPPHNTELLYESTWSFPSGHASGTVAVVGMLMYILVRYIEKSSIKIMILCSGWVWICTVMMSRVMLQVHYPSDVLAGAAISTAWIFLCAAWYEYKQRQYFYQ